MQLLNAENLVNEFKEFVSRNPVLVFGFLSTLRTVFVLAVVILFSLKWVCFVCLCLSPAFFRLHLPQESITQISTAMAASVWIF